MVKESQEHRVLIDSEALLVAGKSRVVLISLRELLVNQPVPVVHLCSVQPPVEYVLSGQRSHATSTALKELVGAGALPSNSKGLELIRHVPSNQNLLNTFHELSLQGFVEPLRPPHEDLTEWRLTPKASSEIRAWMWMTKERPLYDARPDVSFEDMTLFETLLALQRGDWVCRALNNRHLPQPYRVGGPKLFYRRRVSCPVTYLHCLLQAERLLGQGVQEIPHGKTEKFYRCLLEGGVPVPPAQEDLFERDDHALDQQDLSETGQAGRKRARDIGDDIHLSVELMESSGKELPPLLRNTLGLSAFILSSFLSLVILVETGVACVDKLLFMLLMP